jgi:hypothetical protein
VPLLTGGDADLLRGRLQSPVGLSMASGDGHRAGFLIAANLLARLYPQICLSGPDAAVKAATDLILSINPECQLDLVADEGLPRPTLQIGFSANADQDTIVADADGWTARLDPASPPTKAPVVLASLAAACLGVGEIFRVVFSAELANEGRMGPVPFALNLISLEPDGPTEPIAATDLGKLRLVGAGAIGQAALLALRESGLAATVELVDPELIELSNLQRYALAGDEDVGVAKVELAKRALAGSPIKIIKRRQRFDASLVGSTRRPTLVALDSASDRIAVQAAMPGPIYNAWTQPHDLGFSRHERFGEEPCLACLYWPAEARRHRHELIAEALEQDPLRMLAYLVGGVPVGMPLPPGSVPVLPNMPIGPHSEGWYARSLLDDVAQRFGLPAEKLAPWQQAGLDVLYREVVCGIAMLEFSLDGGPPQEASVPLAHQSALAGVMLVVELVAALDGKLAAARPKATEGRLDVLSGWPQVVPRPRQRTAGCLCADRDFLAAEQDREKQ